MWKFVYGDFDTSFWKILAVFFLMKTLDKFQKHFGKFYMYLFHE